MLAFDLETTRLASDVEREFAGELKGESPWSRPDLFGFGVGCVVNVETGMAARFGPGQAAAMISRLRDADRVVSYNGESFDLGVLSAAGDVAAIGEKHLDINAVVMKALDEVPTDHQGMGRLRQGGLDGLAKANGLEGKTGEATSAPQMLRDGHIQELLDYAEQDARIVAGLCRIARETGKIRVEPYLRRGDRTRVPFGPVEVPVPVEVGPESGFCERCGDEAPADELVVVWGVVCQTCAEEIEDGRGA